MLPVGEHTDDYPELDQAPVAAIEGRLLELRVMPGPRDDWFVDPDALVHNVWVASDRSDRVGMRLTGTPMRYRDPDRQLPSEGATRGAIQVPPNGLPVILGPDHPVTGGYPVAGVVVDADIDKVAQIRPGQTVRLHWARPRARQQNCHRSHHTRCPSRPHMSIPCDRTNMCTPRSTPPAWFTPPIWTTRHAKTRAGCWPTRSPAISATPTGSTAWAVCMR